MVSFVSADRLAVAGRRSRTRPWSSAGDTSARVWSIHGNDASIVAGVSRTPGRISRANARVGGNDAFSESNAGRARSRTRGSSAIVSRRLFSSDANAAVVVLKLVIRSLRDSSRVDSFLDVRC